MVSHLTFYALHRHRQALRTFYLLYLIGFGFYEKNDERTLEANGENGSTTPSSTLFMLASEWK